MRILFAILLLTLVLLFLFKPAKNIVREENITPLLGPDLKPLAYGKPVKEFNGYIRIGTWRGLPVYAPRETVFKPIFVDRLSLVAGKPLPPSVPWEWWLEVNGHRIEPIGYASSLFDIHVVTPYEDFRTRENIIGLYSGWHVGRVVEADGCIYVKEFRGVRVPVLLEGVNVVDPDAEKVCYACKDYVTLGVYGDGRPLTGFYTVLGKFFGRFDGEIRLCRCDRVRIYVSGYKPWSGNVCSDKNIILRRLKECKKLEDNYIYIDSVGAFFVGPMCVEEGVYRAFERFPLREVNRDVPMVKVEGRIGKKLVHEASLYSIIFDNRYYYVLENEVVPVDGYICYKNLCLPVGGTTPLLNWGTPLLVERNVFIQKATP